MFLVLRLLKKNLNLAAECRARSRRVTALRPNLEILEGRDVPSALTVSNTKDSGPHSLRAAIADAKANDVIVFSSKLAGSTITLTTGELDITKNLTITGPGAALLTISGNNIWRVFEVAPNMIVNLSGLTISNGFGRGSYSGDPMAGFGGGILNHGALNIDASIVSKNTALDNGGGIYSDGTLTISGTTVTGNYAGYGGGIDNEGTATVSNSKVTNNWAVDQSGFPYSGYVYFGGGIFNAGTLTVSGTTLSGNFGDLGGGIFNVGALTVSGCTVTGNSAGLGGGIYNYGALTVSGTVFGNNYPQNVYGPYTDGGGNTFG